MLIIPYKIAGGKGAAELVRYEKISLTLLGSSGKTDYTSLLLMF